MKKIFGVLYFLFAVSVSGGAFAHSGALDANGGHKDSATGVYHCHKAPCVATSEYKREDWKHWSDFDFDCMNTRHEMLKSASVGELTYNDSGCYVVTGVWKDPYSGKTFYNANDLDVDHIIPLKWAHEHGGSVWSAKAKEQFANNPQNLIVVDDGLNQSKGAKGPTEWLPPNQSFRCEYLKRWETLLSIYADLKMTSAEFRVFNKQLNACN